MGSPIITSKLLIDAKAAHKTFKKYHSSSKFTHPLAKKHFLSAQGLYIKAIENGSFEALCLLIKMHLDHVYYRGTTPAIAEYTVQLLNFPTFNEKTLKKHFHNPSQVIFNNLDPMELVTSNLRISEKNLLERMNTQGKKRFIAICSQRLDDYLKVQDLCQAKAWHFEDQCLTYINIFSLTTDFAELAQACCLLYLKLVKIESRLRYPAEITIQKKLRSPVFCFSLLKLRHFDPKFNIGLILDCCELLMNSAVELESTNKFPKQAKSLMRHLLEELQAFSNQLPADSEFQKRACALVRTHELPLFLSARKIYALRAMVLLEIGFPPYVILEILSFLKKEVPAFTTPKSRVRCIQAVKDSIGDIKDQRRKREAHCDPRLFAKMLAATSENTGGNERAMELKTLNLPKNQ